MTHHSDLLHALFIQVSSDRVTPEARVHSTLAVAAADLGLLSTFVVPEEMCDRDANLDQPAISERRIRTWNRPDVDRGSALVRRARRPAQLAPLVARAAGVLRDVRPDIIYTSQQRIDVLVGRILAARFGLLHVIHLHYSVGPWLGSSTHRHIIGSDHLIAVSEAVRSSAMLRGADPSRVWTILNPTTDLAPREVGGSAATRHALGIDPTAPIVLAAGRLDPGKGHESLLTAFERISSDVPGAQLLVCGESSWGSTYGAHLQERAVQLGLDARVRFLGHRSDLRALMACADVFCLPSELEPFGLVYLEAMQAALPVVAAWSGGVPEIVVHGSTGLLSYPNDTEQLASDLLAVLTDGALRARLGAAGAERAATEYSPERIAPRWYRRLRTFHEEARRRG
ncbi:MAG: glycosyltransferase family 4 protein [Acidimicrobiia bacterium]|nr:glycosyltransferase family 4 protein [Acidimicrobiia bacterium]